MENTLQIVKFAKDTYNLYEQIKTFKDTYNNLITIYNIISNVYNFFIK